MKRESVLSKTLVLVAVGSIVGLSGAATVSARTQAAMGDGQCQILDPADDVGVEVTMTLAQLEDAAVLDDGYVLVTIEPSGLAGVTVPDDTSTVAVRLTPAEHEIALALAQDGTTGMATNVVRSAAWVAKIEEALSGGFAIEFNGAACPYGCQTVLEDNI